MMVTFFVLFTIHFIHSIAPQSSELTDFQKVKFLQSLFRSHQNGANSMDCHALAGTISQSKGLALKSDYDKVERYRVRGNLSEEVIPDIDDFPENNLKDHWIICVVTGNSVNDFEVRHSILCYKGLLIEKRGYGSSTFNIITPTSYKHEQWINQTDFYFFNSQTNQKYKYIQVHLYTPKKHVLNGLDQRSSFLNFVLKEHIRLNQFLNRSSHIFDKYLVSKLFTKLGYITGWEEILKEKIVQEIFPEINPEILNHSLDRYEKITVLKVNKKKGPFVVRDKFTSYTLKKIKHCA